jgi:hypothetical protein
LEKNVETYKTDSTYEETSASLGECESVGRVCENLGELTSFRESSESFNGVENLGGGAADGVAALQKPFET